MFKSFYINGSVKNLFGKRPCVFSRINFDQAGFGATQRDLIAHNFIFDRILKRGIADDFDWFALDESHFGDSFAKGSMATYFGDNSGLSGLKACKGSIVYRIGFH